MLRVALIALIALLCASCIYVGGGSKASSAQELSDSIARGQLDRNKWCLKNSCSVAEENFVRSVELAAHGKFNLSYKAALMCAESSMREENFGLMSLCATRLRLASISERGVQGFAPKDMVLWSSIIDVALKDGRFPKDEAIYEQGLARKIHALNIPDRTVILGVHSGSREYSVYGDLDGGGAQYPIVDMNVNGHILKMGIDTGTPISVIYGGGASKIGAKIFSDISIAAGDNLTGVVNLHPALVDAVNIAGMSIRNNIFLVPEKAPVGIEIDGIVGLDVLGLLGKITIIGNKIFVGETQQQCHMPVVYSFGVYGWNPKLIIQDAKFNSQNVLAVIDTGSAFGITLSSDLVKRFGLAVTDVSEVSMQTFAADKMVRIGRVHGTISMGGETYLGDYEVRGMGGDIYVGMKVFYRDGLYLNFKDMTTCKSPHWQ